jgi:hypothetical protein
LSMLTGMWKQVANWEMSSLPWINRRKTNI